jgi:hypothetical protein
LIVVAGAREAVAISRYFRYRSATMKLKNNMIASTPNGNSPKVNIAATIMGVSESFGGLFSFKAYLHRNRPPAVPARVTAAVA